MICKLRFHVLKSCLPEPCPVNKIIFLADSSYGTWPLGQTWGVTFEIFISTWYHNIIYIIGQCLNLFWKLSFPFWVAFGMSLAVFYTLNEQFQLHPRIGGIFFQIHVYCAVTQLSHRNELTDYLWFIKHIKVIMEQILHLLKHKSKWVSFVIFLDSRKSGMHDRIPCVRDQSEIKALQNYIVNVENAVPWIHQVSFKRSWLGLKASETSFKICHISQLLNRKYVKQ